MSNNNQTALNYLEYGLCPLPKRENEKVAAYKWKSLTLEQISTIKFERLNYNHGIVILTGARSNGLELIDFDKKSKGIDIEKVIRQYLDLVYAYNKALAEKLILIQTPSGGYHTYYYCQNYEANQKLASDNDNVTIIETRGEGGLVVAPPSSGYVVVKGDAINPLSDIPTLTNTERNELIRIARTFNQKVVISRPMRVQTRDFEWVGTTPFQDYNNRGNALDILEKHGIRATKTVGNVVILKRDGTTAEHSGYYYLDSNLMYLFSTSTIFDAEKAYNQSQILAKLEFQDDFKETFKHLIQNGYGDKQPNDSTVYKNNLVQSKLNVPSAKPYYEQVYEFNQLKKEEVAKEKEKQAAEQFAEILKTVKPTDFDAAAKETPAPPVIMYYSPVNSDPVYLRTGQMMLVSGISGTRKTTVLNTFLGMLLNNRKQCLNFEAKMPANAKIIHIETEQSKYSYTSRLLRTFKNFGFTSAPKNFISYNLSTYEASDIRKILYSILETEKDIFCLSIDGLMDIVGDANNLKECQDAILLLKRYLAKNITVISVMHENEGSSIQKMVGHMGSFLKRKIELHLSLSQDKENQNNTYLYCSKSRDNRNFEKIHFTYENNEMVEVDAYF